jgi:hypothetical protein
MDAATQQAVRVRAGDACEYCRLPQAGSRLRFWIDHIVPQQHAGTDDSENLALACAVCNRHKGPNLGGIDPATRRRAWLFNPRTDVWRQHFEWRGARIEGTTPKGRATVAALAMNHPVQLVMRQALQDEGWRPDEPPAA